MQAKKAIVKSSLLPVLIEITKQSASQESWAERQAVEYFFSNTQVNRIGRLQDLTLMFTRYEKAYLAGEKLSLQQLVEGTNIFFTHAGRMLEARGLDPLYGRREKHMLSKDEKRFLEACIGIQMRNTDIAYFCGINNPWILTPFYDKQGKPAELRQTINPVTGKKGFSYRTASRIYELQDKGIKPARIEARLNTRPSWVCEAIEHRAIIEPMIIDMLRQRYPDRQVTKPYRTWR